MINRQSLWFITLFSLVLVLGIYYITIPNDFLKTEVKNKTNEEVNVSTDKSDMLVALRVEREEQVASKMASLQTVLVNDETSIEDKNSAFEELKLLNLSIGKESELEKELLNKFKIKSYIEINKDQIKVVVNSKEHDAKLANDIMRMIQSNFKDKMYITVKFEKK